MIEIKGILSGGSASGKEGRESKETDQLGNVDLCHGYC